MHAESPRPPAIGLSLRPIEQRSAGTIPRWGELLDLASQAEALGVDALWIPDHVLLDRPGGRPDGAWDAWSIVAALAARTTRITLGLLVSCTAFRNPALTAKMAETVDEISGGRLVLGLGAGWSAREFRALGIPYTHRVGLFEDAVTIIARLLRTGSADVAGSQDAARRCELRPRVPRPQGLPILIGSTGQGPRMLRIAATHADLWNRGMDAVTPGVEPYSVADLAAWGPLVDAACVAVGRDPAQLVRTAHVRVHLPGARDRPAPGALSGGAEAIVRGLWAYAAAGFAQLQLWIDPETPAGVASLAEVLRRLDR